MFRMICLLGLASVAVIHLVELMLSGPATLRAFLIEWLPLYAVWGIQLGLSWWQPNQHPSDQDF
ncbi:hypothetical protein KDD30_11355 [Photobacterium sp. GJ3]|uniref:hypothetical protein n=1 Tax=Photobacterium sp. GJ3 TaxID=2829502 RepID=UPI001B8AD643|nr:hypothetical protein [Photobacterium sp. GJ3]QUJ66742.1 hypothetical protein KDD30_11355 [Photobacterium sp. GJ3]